MKSITIIRFIIQATVANSGKICSYGEDILSPLRLSTSDLHITARTYLD
jgi:hypothetical protein